MKFANESLPRFDSILLKMMISDKCKNILHKKETPQKICSSFSEFFNILIRQSSTENSKFLSQEAAEARFKMLGKAVSKSLSFKLGLSVYLSQLMDALKIKMQPLIKT